MIFRQIIVVIGTLAMAIPDFLLAAGPPTIRAAADESSVASSANLPGCDFPRVDAQSRALIKIEAPKARQVQVRLGWLYTMAHDANGTWTLTTDSLTPGFHYYSILIDGVEVPDPNTESFFAR